MDLTSFEMKALKALSTGSNMPASWVGNKMWTDRSTRRAQGLARLAGRFLKSLKDKGLATDYIDSYQCFWNITSKGRKYLQEESHD